jgi:hypothetical protein
MISKKILREYIQKILLEAIKTPQMSGELKNILDDASKEVSLDERFKAKQQSIISALEKAGFQPISDRRTLDLQDAEKREVAGSTRIVYGNENIVIKIAFDLDGLKQNKNEYNSAKNPEATLVRMVDVENQKDKQMWPMWIAFERVDPMTETKFKEIFGISHALFSNTVCSAVDKLRDSKNPEEVPKEIEIASKKVGYGKAARIIRYWINFFVFGNGKDVACGDTLKLPSLGFSKLTNNVVTFDYGLNLEMRKQIIAASRQEKQQMDVGDVVAGPEGKTGVRRKKRPDAN